MHVSFSDTELAFQDEVRSFFRNEYPADIRDARENGGELSPEMQVRWQ